MTVRSGTTLGVSAGNGMIHCALVSVDDHGRLTTDSRVIDVDPTDGLDRAGRVNSGIDLMLDRARRIESPAGGVSVGSIGVAVRTTDQGREIASRGVGPRRQVHLVGDAEAVAHALAESGEIATHPEVLVVDCGDSGVTVFRLDTGSGSISDMTRSTGISGFALDAALADRVAADTAAMASRAGWAALVSGCRTAKEDLSLENSTSFAVAGVNRSMSVAMLDEAITPMAEVAAADVVAYRQRCEVSATTPIVLVGGLANIPMLREILVRDTAVEVICPDSPELLCAVGAALLARSGPSRAATLSPRLAFIGGRRHRDWLSAVPLAIIGSLLAGTMLTVYAVGAALTGNSTPEDFSPSTPVSSVVGQPAADVSTQTGSDIDPATRSVTVPAPTGTSRDRSQSTPDTDVETTEPIATSPVPTRPRWRTTELPTTVPSSQVQTSTITPQVAPPGPSAVPGAPTSSGPNPYSEPIAPDTGAPPPVSLIPYPDPFGLVPRSSVPLPRTAPPPVARTTAPVG